MTAPITESFQQLTKALNALKVMLDKPMEQDRGNIDASIQRFEFCVELFWKYLKRIIESRGKEVSYPKDVLQEAYAGKLIDDESTWLQMLRDRNLTSHTYNEQLADEIYTHIKLLFYPVMKKTLDALGQKPRVSQ